jgi:hypothetical protein
MMSGFRALNVKEHMLVSAWSRTVLQSGPNATRKREDFNCAVELLAEHSRVRLVPIGKRRRVVVKPALLDRVVAIGSDDHLLDEC